MLPSPLPIQPIFGQDGFRDQGNREVLHDQGEDYQQPINFRSGSTYSTYECWGYVWRVHQYRVNFFGLTYPNPVLN